MIANRSCDLKLIEGLTKTCLAVCALRGIMDKGKGKGHLEQATKAQRGIEV
jgi:hypothetical protein